MLVAFHHIEIPNKTNVLHKHCIVTLPINSHIQKIVDRLNFLNLCRRIIIRATYKYSWVLAETVPNIGLCKKKYYKAVRAYITYIFKSIIT